MPALRHVSKMANSESRGRGSAVLQRCHTTTTTTAEQRVGHRVQMLEEYVLDEQDLNTLQLFDMPLASKSVPHPKQQQRHLRRSAELRTVSIIETLSELVSRTDNGDLGAEHVGGRDCDGQCRQQHHQCHLFVNGNNSDTHWTPCKHRNSSTNATILDSCAANGHIGIGEHDRNMLEACHQQQQHRNAPNSPNCGAGFDGNHCGHCIQQTRYCDVNPWPVSKRINVPNKDMVVDPSGSLLLVPPPVRHHPLSPPPPPPPPTSNTKMSGFMIQTNECHNKNKTETSISIKQTPNQKGFSNGGGGGGRGIEGLVFPSRVFNGKDGGGGGGGPVACSRTAVHRDPSHFMLSTLKSKGRTPDWIAGIFSIARRGNLNRLSHALSDMDATLIRNLSDHRGNNLFHVCCCYGHLECLQWLLLRGKQCEDAILDENKYELTPLVCAVKYGKLPCVEWLIINTIARGQLVPSSGSRPLLHWAAKYGQEVILRWLAQYMENNSMDVNVKDGYGNTSLHLAAKHGHATSIKALVTHRCDVSLKNDLGYKASDYATLYSQVACSEYLLSLEACLMLSANVASLDYDLNSTKAEMSEMKTQFKDVLACAKKLVKERDELSQHLDRLQDGLVHLNNAIITEIQALVEENSSLREKVTGTKNQDNTHRHLDETIALCHAMHTRWQEGQQRWLSLSSLSEIQQKIIMAEEKWKRARTRVTWGERESREHMNVFRERLTQVQCRATGIRLSDIRSISSSESSLASMEETMSEYEDRYGSVSSPLLSATDAGCNCQDAVFGGGIGANDHCTGPIISPRIQCPPPVPRRPPLSTGGIMLQQESSPLQRTNMSQNYEHQMTKELSGNVQQDAIGGRTLNLVTQGTCKVLEVIVSSNSDGESQPEHNASDRPTTETSTTQPWNIESTLTDSPRVRFCDGISQNRSKKMNSSLGDCKGEVLECSHGRSDDDDADTDGKTKGLKGIRRGDCNCKNRNEGRREGSNDNKDRHGSSNSQEVQGRSHTKFPESSSRSLRNTGINGTLISPEPDLIIGTKGIRNIDGLFLDESEYDLDAADETIGMPQEDNAIVNVQQQVIPSEPELNRMATNVDNGSIATIATAATAEEFFVIADTSQETSVSLEDVTLTGGGSTTGVIPVTKRKGFLQKLSLRWPSKRKVKAPSSKKGLEISAEDFRETYLHLRNGNGDETIWESQDPSNEPTTSKEMLVAAASRLSLGEGELKSGGVCIKQRSKSLIVVNSEGGSSYSDKPHSEASSRTVSQLELNTMGMESCLVSPRETNAANEATATSSAAALTSQDNACIRPSISCPNDLSSVGQGPVPLTSTPQKPTPPPPPPSLSQNTGGPVDSNRDRDMSQCPSIKPGNDKNSVNTRGGDDDRNEDDNDEEEEGGKPESPPEAEQGVSFDHGLSMPEEDSSSLHAQANMPPKRPTSRGAKSDHCFSRPESSASRTESYSAYRLPAGYPLRKVSSVSTDLLTPDSLTPSRMSPAPSEVSKTESALSPPSDISKTESMRQLTRIEEITNRVDTQKPVPAIPMSRLANVKTANIVDTTNPEVQKQQQQQQQQQASAQLQELVLKKQAQDVSACRSTTTMEIMSTTNLLKESIGGGGGTVEEVFTRQGNCGSKENAHNTRLTSKAQKPWYELSDDEEILMPETLTRNAPLVKSSSEEDEAGFFCA